MSTTTTITNFCQIAEEFGQKIGLAEFEIERIVHTKSAGIDEWVFHLKFDELDPLIEIEEHGAIVVVDATTKVPRLIEGL